LLRHKIFWVSADLCPKVRQILTFVLLLTLLPFNDPDHSHEVVLNNISKQLSGLLVTLVLLLLTEILEDFVKIYLRDILIVVAIIKVES